MLEKMFMKVLHTHIHIHLYVYNNKNCHIIGTV